VWLIPPAIVATILFGLPFITIHHLPQESKLHQEFSSVSGGKNNKHDDRPTRLDGSMSVDQEYNHDQKDSGKVEDNKDNDVMSRILLQPDGYFNGEPLFYNEAKTYSSVHCIGETFQKKYPWIYRSCHYQHLCFDLDQQEFVLFQSPQERKLQRLLRKQQQDLFHVSTLLNRTDQSSVSIGGINTKWTWKEGVPRLKWSPKLVTTSPPPHYEMNVTWIPFHSMAGFNPGHLVWDDWLPIYTLIRMFQLDPMKLMLTRYILPGASLMECCRVRFLWCILKNLSRPCRKGHVGNM
jgi:hypothetical protein